MEMFIDIFLAFLVGIAASVPVGPVAILVIQKTLSKGFRAGFITGLGASVVDTLFAVIAVFALAATQQFLADNKLLVGLIGGVVLVVVGLIMALKDPFKKMKADGPSKASAADFLQAVFMTISNPGAIAFMFGLLTFAGICQGDAPGAWQVAPILFAIAAGSVTYWFLISWGLSRFRHKFSMNTLLWISRVMGALVVIIGVVLLAMEIFDLIY
jgi:threonine/homoserine/homoserine lactone efflux protein